MTTTAQKIRTAQTKLAAITRAIAEEQAQGIPMPFAFLDLVERAERLEARIARLSSGRNN